MQTAWTDRVARPAGAVLLLALLVVSVYAPVRGFEFITLDDLSYVERNPNVNQGISGESVAWAFRATHVSNWHPLTWLSHQFDVERFGLEPGPHHVSNVALHALAVLLLFGALRTATGSAGRSFAVAALFAVHPVNVESVAWVAQRKTVLCAVFLFAALWAYVGYARRGGRLRFAGVTALFAASLLAKPLAVTLPFVFLLVDRWPLARLESRADCGRASCDEKSDLARHERRASCIVTYLAQVVQWSRTQELRCAGSRCAPGERRWSAMCATSATRSGPTTLALYYPHPNLPGGTCLGVCFRSLGAAVLLVALTGLASRRPICSCSAGCGSWAWRCRRWVSCRSAARPWPTATSTCRAPGWRSPSFGHSADIAAGCAPGACSLALAAIARSGAFAWRAHDQVGYWSDSRTLYTHSVEVAPGSALLTVKLAILLRAAGEVDAAVARYNEVLAYDPDYYSAHHNLGTIYRSRGDHASAARSLLNPPSHNAV